MQKIFLYDPVSGEFALNEPELKLIREFNDLWLLAKQRCECVDVNDNGIGHGNSEAIMKFANYCKFVYLYADYASPYRDYPDNDRRIQAAYDGFMSDEESSMPELYVACDKWVDMQSQDRNVRILRAGQRQVDELIAYFSEEGKLTLKKDGKPVYKAKDIMSELRDIGSISDELDRHEERVRAGDAAESKIRGGAQEGIIIDFAKEAERRKKLKEQQEGNVKLKSEQVDEKPIEKPVLEPVVKEFDDDEPDAPVDAKPSKRASKRTKREEVTIKEATSRKKPVKKSTNFDWMKELEKL